MTLGACAQPAPRGAVAALQGEETAETAAAAGQRTATMPPAVRGQWRRDDIGRAPTQADCRTKAANMDKVLSVRADGYSVFENGGRIIEVHDRTDTMIDATFDTTYADTPTQARTDFAAQADGSLIVDDDVGDGTMAVTSYRRCPGE